MATNRATKSGFAAEAQRKSTMKGAQHLALNCFEVADISVTFSPAYQWILPIAILFKKKRPTKLLSAESTPHIKKVSKPLYVEGEELLKKGLHDSPI
ncbi:hypothetical protein HUJ05_009276 [Dendroctonus ponderosae]|nr:hypothetical protein HUJ05_009276 [Dendroctonus ponderosae]